ncbi:hypothetical protein LJC71_04005 [Desulfosarcina sp. OttesenSCG-928-A07]|nr:hypothetical protein [Desulfosarcina sp. OttesenSCG-928-A07]
MKKMAFVAALALIFMSVGSVAFANEKDMAGAWQIAEPCAISQDAQDAFKEATKDLTGASYEALYVAATQVVSGTNYLFIAKQTLVTAQPKTTVVKLIIYKAIGKNAEIKNDSIVPLL